ncbi:hypothetical protein V6N12_039261 [Hibiscus sabdariffa]|uniref:Uncharacterized protein n=1 Tax=Hibiscus sabdariffa TaxID=183260 RepID=A0ABR2E051_9ROSI
MSTTKGTSKSEHESPFTSSRSVIYKARFHRSKICVHHLNVDVFGTQLRRDPVIKRELKTYDVTTVEQENRQKVAEMPREWSTRIPPQAIQHSSPMEIMLSIRRYFSSDWNCSYYVQVVAYLRDTGTGKYNIALIERTSLVGTNVWDSVTLRAGSSYFRAACAHADGISKSELESPFTNSRSVIYKAQFNSSKICFHYQNVAVFGTHLRRDSVIKV